MSFLIQHEKQYQENNMDTLTKLSNKKQTKNVLIICLVFSLYLNIQQWTALSIKFTRRQDDCLPRSHFGTISSCQNSIRGLTVPTGTGSNSIREDMSKTSKKTSPLTPNDVDRTLYAKDCPTNRSQSFESVSDTYLRMQELARVETGGRASVESERILGFLEKIGTGQAPSLEEYHCWLAGICQAEDAGAARRDGGLKERCPCLPKGLEGPLKIDKEFILNRTSWDAKSDHLKDVRLGGHWAPTSCVARRRVAVVVPYRDRERHLQAFLSHMHPILQRQLVEYRIFVVEQNFPYVFNKAAIMNAGYLEAKKLFDPDCVLFHDVDTLTERGDNMAACGHQPVHWGGYSDRFNYTFQYVLFGSAVMVRPDVFESVNGFSNLFFGWGGEDDNLKYRFWQKRISIYRGPMEITRCSIMEHDRDVLFFLNETDVAIKMEGYFKMKTDPIWQEIDGLNTASYAVLNVKKYTSHTWILVDVKASQVKWISKEYDEQAAKLNSLASWTVPEYDFTIVNCTINSKMSVRHYLSRISCRFLCEQYWERCNLFTYHDRPKDDKKSFCVLRLAYNCRPSETVTTEIYTRHNMIQAGAEKIILGEIT